MPNETTKPMRLTGRYSRETPGRFPDIPIRAVLILYARASSIQPDVFHSPAVVLTVDHQGQALDLRLPAGCSSPVIENGSGQFLLQRAVDFLHQQFALGGIAF